MAEYTTEQMTALTQISDILTSNGLTVKDLPEGASLANEAAQMAQYKELSETYHKRFNDKVEDHNELLYRILPKFYQEMVDQTSEEEAYEWVEKNILAHYTFDDDRDKWTEKLADAGIKPKRFKIMEISMTFRVVMPDDAYDGDWDDFVDVEYLDWGNADYDVIEDNLSESDIDNGYYDLANSIVDLK